MISSRKKIRKRWLVAAGFLACGLAILFFSGPWLAARILETWVIPTAFESMGIRRFNVSVNSIGFRRSELGPVRIGSAKNPTLTVKSISIEYSPSKLLDDVIDAISVEGVAVNVNIQDGELLTGLPAIDKRINSPTPESKRDKRSSTSFSVKKIDVREAAITVDGPAPFLVDVAQLSGSLVAGAIKLRATPSVLVQSFKRDDVSLTSSVAVPMLVNGDLDANGDWRVNLQTAPVTDQNEAFIQFGETKIAVPAITMTATANGTKGKMSCDVEAKLAKLAGRGFGVEMTTGAAMTTVHANFGEDASFSGKAELKDLDIQSSRENARGASLNLEISNHSQAAAGVEASPLDFLLDAGLTVSLANGSLSSGDGAYAVNGLRCELTIPTLRSTRSAPHQELSFENVRLGDLEFTAGVIRFLVEGPEAVFIENAKVGWCDGELVVDSLRLDAEAGELDVAPRCERINLSQFFRQCTPALATGEGTVSGRLPISLRDGSVRFHDAYLGSPPGEGGILRLTGGSLAGAGLPPDAPQRIQLEMAEEALKEFQYDWLKIKANSENGEDVVSFSVYGRPVRPIPFKYENDQYVRIEHQGEVRVTRPMRLDVNVTFSLDDVFDLGEELNETIKNSLEPGTGDATGD